MPIIHDNEHLKQQIGTHNDRSEQLGDSAIRDRNSRTVSQAYASEENELKYLLIRDELTKRQIILDEVLLINEALRVKIKEYEVDNLKLPLVSLPTQHASVQTVDSMELVEKRKIELLQAVKILNENRSQREQLENFRKSEMSKSIADDEVAENLSVMSRGQSNCDDSSATALKETICKLKVDERKRKRKFEKLVLKNFTLKIEICELKKEIKKYANVWANDRYFNSLFLDAAKQTIAK